MTKSLEKLKIEFLEYLEVEKNRSRLTIANYDHYLSRFIEFAAARGTVDPEDIDLELIRAYRLALNRLSGEKGDHLKLITQTYHVIALRSFLKYLSKRDIKTLAAEKIELPKTPSRQVQFLETDELGRLLEATSSEKDPLARLRDRAVIELLFSTGLRVSELAALTRQRVNAAKGEFSVRGKGDKIRVAFMSDTAKRALADYLAARRDTSPALFIAHRNAQSVEKQIAAQDDGARSGEHPAGLTPRSIQRIIKKYSHLAGITKDITPHTLRHTFATDLLRGGADLRAVQEMLGHSSVTTTQVYTHITDRRLREIHKRFHGKSE